MDKKLLNKFYNICTEVFESFVAIHKITEQDEDIALNSYLLIVFQNRRPITIYIQKEEFTVKDFINEICYYL